MLTVIVSMSTPRCYRDLSKLQVVTLIRIMALITIWGSMTSMIYFARSFTHYHHLNKLMQYYGAVESMCFSSCGMLL